eukprot:tig00000430_g664.t1
MNYFARLPDELVQRILSELEAGEAFEKNQLRSSKLAEIWPLLKKIRCAVLDGSALRELSVLPLEDLRVVVRSMNADGLEEALASLKADTADDASGDLLVGLGALEKLHTLDLHLDLSKASDGGAAALNALAAGLAAARWRGLSADVRKPGSFCGWHSVSFCERFKSGPLAIAAGPSGSSGPAAGPPPAEEQLARLAGLQLQSKPEALLREALCRAATVVGRSVIDASGARAAKEAAERSAARIRKELEASRAEAARLRARVAELEAASAEQEADLAALAAAASAALGPLTRGRAAGAAASAAGGPRAAGGQENAEAGGGRAPAPASAPAGGKAGRPRSAPKPLATRNE